VTAQFDSALLLHNAPVGRGIDLMNWYKYQRHTAIHHIYPDDGDRGDLRNVGFRFDLLALHSNPEGGVDIFLRNVRLSPNYLAFKPRRPWLVTIVGPHKYDFFYIPGLYKC
jgi:hypothetical protein